MSSGSGVPIPAVAGVRHHFVEAAGVRFHVAESGPEDGEPILLLHGWPQHWYAWRKVKMAVELRDDSGHFINEELPDLVASRARTLFSDDCDLRGQTEEGA